MAAETVAQDQRKRALEALERRFAFAEAEALQQTRNKKRRHEQDSPVHEKDTSPMSSARRAATPSRTSNKKDLEVDDPIYSHISQPLHENFTTADGISDKGKGISKKILHELFQSGDIAEKYMRGSRSKKLDNWILLDNHVHVHGTSASNLRAPQHLSKRSKRRMSMKQLKKCGIFELPEFEFHKFDTYLPVHEMWKNYVVQLLKNSSKDHVAQCLLGADLQGAIVQVAECKRKAFIGVTGIVIVETAETFQIITQDNKIKVVPKKGSVFLLQADCWKITLQGDKLASRNMC